MLCYVACESPPRNLTYCQLAPLVMTYSRHLKLLKDVDIFEEIIRIQSVIILLTYQKWAVHCRMIASTIAN